MLLAGFECDEGTCNTDRIGGMNTVSMRTVPVNQSAGPLPEGCEPLRVISHHPSPSLMLAAVRPMAIDEVDR